ncbi:WD40 repeat domain-containing serine/threonine protein kinase [Actinomadura sp. GTD37]|uniref:WD40 repeat domain-containing serine/threonine protein kinase n=1 Tax=Actinomadura sp. GTD37 TaxID=1778030 RepID=UPI0035BEB72F
MGEDVGQLLAGRYRILGLLGRGGMGSVWRALDVQGQREVAVKELRLPDQIGEDERRVLHARMEREARAAARLSHPGVVRVHAQVAGADGRPWIVMELVRGGSLADLVRERGRLPVPQVAAIGLQMLDALTAAHGQGIVHRDVKPANVLLEGERAVLTDFGIAALEGDATLTGTGAILGTPAYMAPEQVRGTPATPRSDLWSLGATLYAAVEGRAPFAGPNHGAVYLAVATEEHPPPVHAGPLTGVLSGLLRKDPDARLPAGAVRGMLAAIASPTSEAVTTPWGRPVRDVRQARGVRAAALAAAASLVVGGLAAGVWALRPSAPDGRTASASPKPLPPGVDVPGGVWGMAFSPNGKTLATVGEAGGLELWDVATGKWTARLAERDGVSKFRVEFSPDGTTLAADDGDGDIGLWDVASGRSLDTFTDPDEDASPDAIAFSPDGDTLAIGVSTIPTVSEDARHMIRLWNVDAHRIDDTLRGMSKSIQSVRFSPDGALLAGNDDQDVRLWTVAADRNVRVLDGHDGFVRSVAFSPDGETLAVGADEGIRLWDVDDRRPGLRLDGDGDAEAPFSPNGRYVAGRAKGDVNSVRVWDAATGAEVKRVGGHTEGVYALAFDPAGGLLATSDDSGAVKFSRVP